MAPVSVFDNQLHTLPILQHRVSPKYSREEVPGHIPHQGGRTPHNHPGLIHFQYDSHLLVEGLMRNLLGQTGIPREQVGLAAGLMVVFVLCHALGSSTAALHMEQASEYHHATASVHGIHRWSSRRSSVD